MKKLIKNFTNMLNPNELLYRKFLEMKFQFFLSSLLEKFKDKHLHERCFIIGNAPSLKHHNLDLLKSEKTFVTNMFLLHPKAIELSPTYYCISDWLHWSYQKKDSKILYTFPDSLKTGIPKLKNTNFFFEIGARKIVKRTRELKNSMINYFYLNERLPVYLNHFTTDVRRPVYWGQSVTIDICVPLAAFMGFKEIYLIGNDYDYKVETASKIGENTYFYDIKTDDRNIPKRQSHLSAFIDKDRTYLANRSFEVIHKRLSTQGIKIFNAGLNGKLTSLPRVDYNKLF